MRRYVLDTNVLLNSLDTIVDIIKRGDQPVIPLMVMEELDKFKGRGSNEELKFKARKIIRFIRKNEKDIKFIHDLRTGWKVILDSFDMDDRYQDNKILMLDIFDKEDAILITGDQAMYYKAKTLGIDVAFTEDTKTKEEAYTGARGYLISKEAFKDLNSTKEENEIIKIDMLETITNLKFKDLSKNEFIHFMEKSGGDIIFRQKSTFDMERNVIEGVIKVSKSPNQALGITPQNREQMMLSSILRDKQINIVTITGKAGSGKTLMAMAQALRDVNYNYYDRLILGKDTTPLSKQQYQGFTTGSTDEKLLTHFGNYSSTLEYIFKQEMKQKDIKDGKQMMGSLITDGKLGILDISAIKGTSFDNKIIILDEVQTLSKMEMRAIITRVKDNCKLILIGDLKQGASYNPQKGDIGLEEIIKMFKPCKHIAHITLQETMRGIIQQEVLEALGEE